MKFETPARIVIALVALSAPVVASQAAEQTTDPFAGVAEDYTADALPLVQKFCLECHSTAAQEGELDLEQFAKLDDVRRGTKAWLKVAEMLDNGEMPPKDAAQPTPEERKRLRGWVAGYLHVEALAHAGDPGPVALRRLNNAQFNFTVRDLTGVDLRPAREFPADGAAGEGFTNAGNALVMSPSLLTKYLDAGKEIARHAVLLPDGIRFSPGVSRRDWTDERLAEIRATYRRYTDPSGGTKVNLQGLSWETNQGGRLPLEHYLAATLECRAELAKGAEAIAAVAAERGLNAKYLTSLWQLLNDDQASLLVAELRDRWRTAQPSDAAALVAQVARWQEVLTRFQAVGHMKTWMAPMSPLVARQEIRQKLPASADGRTVTLYLAAGTAGDGAAQDLVVWERPRLVAPGRPELLLRDVRGVTERLAQLREQIFAATVPALAAADEAGRAGGEINVAELATKHGADAVAVRAWLDFLGIGPSAALDLAHLQDRIETSAGYAFVQGWGTNATPNVVANASDQHVRIPGNMKPHGVVMHPAPTLQVAAGWRSPVTAQIRVQGKVTSAHPECGNGVTWSLEVRRGRTRQTLAAGNATGGAPGSFDIAQPFAVRTGDLVSLSIGPRDGNHGCDLTDIELVISTVGDEPREWNLAADVSPDMLAGNPHADRQGHADVWHFYTEPVDGGTAGPAIPAGSLLARWQAAGSEAEKRQLAEELLKLLTGTPPADAQQQDAQLYRQLTSLSGPLFLAARADAPSEAAPSASAKTDSSWGLDPAMFGSSPVGATIDRASLAMQAPATIEIRLPADLAEGAEFVSSGVLDATAAAEGSVQLLVAPARPDALEALRPDAPVLVGEAGAARQRYERAFDDHRRWFPRAVCYPQIVPVDEVVTLTLFHREDEPLCRLMLDDGQRAALDRLWNELHFVSQDAFASVDAFAQLMEYATQDSDPGLFEPFRKPIYERAAAYREELVAAEPRHLEAAVQLASQAYRRRLSDAEADELRALYRSLRAQELPHEDAIRFTLARIFVAPAFLYRWEEPPSGEKPGPVSSWEMASRLSYFLWSSLGDETLRSAAEEGRLNDAEELATQARRMLGDERVRRLAGEFACQWLHIYDFDTLDEKSERHFPEFVALRGDMYEEAQRFFTDLFQRDGSVLEILNADHLFVNEALAKFYGIPNVAGPEWRRVDNAAAHGRGGILGLAATLAKQSGASRTSPTLRGNWVSEVLLGEKLPKPPKDVPQLPEDEAAIEGLTVRQLVEKHASDARCAGCHVRVDPLGFALEAFDAVGRRRTADLANRPIDTSTRLADGTQFDGLTGLRDYLLSQRRDVVVRQFCRKLLGYALGRGLQLSDEPLLDEICQTLARENYRFSTAVIAIVQSRQFREIRGRDAQFAEAP
ncbi:MAG: DUF1592 domain-containing protein [Pirellulales bacterium]